MEQQASGRLLNIVYRLLNLKFDVYFRVALPDGRIQIVTYHADHVAGYTADVRKTTNVNL